MAKVKVFNMEGKAVSEVELADSVFAIEPNNTAMHTAVVTYLANQRQGTQSTKTRAEVSGGGKKPWRQKGTGRARQGSTRSPQWTHGGVALGPKPRDYRLSMNKKLRKLAILSALSSKLSAGELIVVDKLDVAEHKTKTVVRMLEALNAVKKPLIVAAEKNEYLISSASNIPNTKTALFNTISTYDILNCDKFIITVEAAKLIEEVYAQ